MAAHIFSQLVSSATCVFHRHRTHTIRTSQAVFVAHSLCEDASFCVTVWRRLPSLERRAQAGIEDQLRRALQKIKAQEDEINGLRSRPDGAQELSTE